MAANAAEVYEGYFVPGNFGRWAPLLVEHAAPHRGERALDVACGTGIVARNLAPVVGAEGAVTGVDRNPEMLAVARAVDPPPGATIEWLEGDAADLPNGPFDLVLCQQGLQFFPDRPAAVAEMRRVIPDDGRAIVSVWQGLERQSVYAALAEAESAHLDLSVEEIMGPPFTMGDPDALGSLFEHAGFGDVEVSPATRTVRFPSPERFVRLTVMAAAAVLPIYDDLDDEARTELVEAVSRDLRDVIAAHTDGEEVAFPMHAYIVVARA